MRTASSAATYAEKVERGEAFANVVGLGIGAEREDWNSYEEAYLEKKTFKMEDVSKPEDPLLLNFTSGTTAKPKLVLHTHQSYPVGAQEKERITAGTRGELEFWVEDLIKMMI